MDKVLERLKEELDLFSDNNMMVTVKRSDLELLVKAYEKLKEEEMK